MSSFATLDLNFWRSSCLSWSHQNHRKHFSYTTKLQSRKAAAPTHVISMKSESQPALSLSMSLSFQLLLQLSNNLTVVFAYISEPIPLCTLLQQFQFNKTPQAKYLLYKSWSNRYLSNGVVLYLFTTQFTSPWAQKEICQQCALAHPWLASAVHCQVVLNYTVFLPEHCASAPSLSQ